MTLEQHRLKIKSGKKAAIFLAITVFTSITFSGVAIAQDDSSIIQHGEKEERQSIAKIRSVEFTNLVDRDGDGYYSNFDLVIEADTDCYGCYDDEGWGGDAEGEYFFAVKFNNLVFPDVRSPECDTGETCEYLPHDNYLRHHMDIPVEQLEDENLERGEISFQLYLYDNDVVKVDEIDSRTLTIKYEPSYQDKPSSDGNGDGGESDTGSNEEAEEDTDYGAVGLNVSYEDGGNVSYPYSNLQVPQNSSKTYREGGEVTLEANPAEGYEFDHWSGDVPEGQKTNETITIQLESDKEVIAHFTPKEDTSNKENQPNQTYELSINATEGGTVKAVHPDTKAVHRDQSNLSLSMGQNITVETIPSSGYKFSHWSGDVPSCNKYVQNYRTEIMSDQQVKAHFVPSDSKVKQTLSLSSEYTTGTNGTISMRFAIFHPNLTALRGTTLVIEAVPEDWAVINTSTHGGSWAPASNTLFWKSPSSNCLTPSITFQRGDSAQLDKQTVTAMVKTGDETAQTNISIDAPSLVTQLKKVSSTSVQPGEEVTVSYQITNNVNKSLTGVTLSLESTPENWTIVNQTATSGNWAPDDQLWFWPTMETGQSATVTVTFRVPLQTSSGDYLISATSSGTSGREQAINTTVTVANISQTSTAEGQE